MKSKGQQFHLLNPAVSLAITLLVVQQLIVASSTLWVTRLIAHIQNGHFSYPLLGLYLASLFLPYFPGGAALIEMAKAKMCANVQFVNRFAKVYHSQVAEWTNSSHQSTTCSILTGEAPQVINNYLDYIYHFVSCGLNISFNLVILSLVVEPLLIVSYAVGILFASMILIVQKKWKQVLSLRAQQGRIKWTSMLLGAWDNVLIGNAYNFNIWNQKTSQRGKRLVGTTLKLESLSQAVSIGMAFILFGPSFALICYLPILHEYNLTSLAVIVVALPRLFQMLSYSYEMLFILADFPMQKSRMKTVAKLLDVPSLCTTENARQSLEKRIQWDKIRLLANEVSIPIKTLFDSPLSQGRYTLKGENGSGKSSLLLLLKMTKGEEALYLPVRHTLFFRLPTKDLSTGQLVQKILQELLDGSPASIILLDEWDANLDTANQQRLSRLIDELAQRKCVVEVRHR